MTTLQAINKALTEAGREERLVRGRGYYYVTGGGSERWPQTMIYQYSLIDTTVEKVIRAIDQLKAASN